MRGREIFLERSELNQRSNATLAILVVLAVAVLGVAFFRAFDGWFTGSTLVSQAIVLGTGQALVSAMILRRSAYKARWGERAFSAAFCWLAIPALALIIAGLPHFVYSGVLRMALALLLWNGGAFALFAGAMGLLSMTAWVRLVEERELIERFGDGYRRYRAQTPAFFNLNPRTWTRLWRFLAAGK